MGKASRDKGNRTERAIVKLLQEFGFAGERVPLSGAARGRFGGDVSVPFLGVDRRVEVKARATGFARLYDWLKGHYCLIVKADGKPPLLIIELTEGTKVAALAEAVRRNSASAHWRADD